MNRYHILGEMGRHVGWGRGAGELVVVRSPNHIGDILEAVPLMKAIRAFWPTRTVVWMVGAWSAALARRWQGTYVDEVIVFNSNSPGRLRGHQEWHQSVWEQWKVAWALRRRGVDVFILAGNEDAESRFLANVLRPRVWTALGGHRPPRVAKGIETRFEPYSKSRREADALVSLLDRAGGKWSGTVQLEYAVREDERRWADDFLRGEGLGARKFAIFSPGSGWGGKNWSAERFGELAIWLEDEKKMPVAWTGSASERSLLPAMGVTRNWMGGLSLAQLGAVLERAAVWVGNDSGPMHLAEAVGCRTVSFWGPTSEQKWGPRGEEHVQLRGAVACPGCVYWDWQRECGKQGHPCMEAIGVEDAKAALEALGVV